MKKIFLNGKIVNENRALMSFHDIGVLRAVAVFDFGYGRNGKVFALDDHIRRFLNSAKKMRIKIGYDTNEIIKLTNEVISANKMDEYYLRWVLTGGLISDYQSGKNGNFAILIENVHKHPKSFYEKGVLVKTFEYRRFNPEIKHTNYQLPYLNLIEMKKDGFHEGIYVKDGVVLEGFTSNIFIVRNQKVYTPKKDILPGITRNRVIKICNNLNIAVFKNEIKVGDLIKADEVFITSTTRGVMPVVGVDNKRIGDGRVSVITKLISEKYKEMEQKEFC